MELIDRAHILDTAKSVVTGQREEAYGAPEDSFRLISALWSPYVSEKCAPLGSGVFLTPDDVAVMMALLKIARLTTSPNHADSWIDLAGYAACGGEIACRKPVPAP